MSISDDDYVGEPGYPAPWTTSSPREGLRDTDDAIIVSLAPDVCKSPGTPIPYPVVEFCGHDDGYTKSVRFTGKKAMVFRSTTTEVHGDEPGRGGGVVSGTCGGICEPIEHADQVFAEGSPVIRHLDKFHMNNRNTTGEAIFVRDMGVYAAPRVDDPVPGSMQYAELSGETMTDGSFFAQPEVELPPVEVPAPEAPPPPDPSPPPPPESRLRRALRRLGRFGRSVKINPFQWWLQHTIEKYPEDRRRIRADELARASQNESLSDEAQEILRETARRMRKASIPDAAQEIEQEGWERLRELEAEGRLNRPEADTATEEDTEPRPIPAPEESGTRVDEDFERRCPIKTIEFDSHGDPVEFSRQIEEQEARLNRMTPTEYMARRGPIGPGVPGRSGVLKQRRKDSLPHQKEVRDDYIRTHQGPYIEEHGRTAWNEHLASLAATHELDLIAGGYENEISGMGGAAENSSIGPQWRARRRSGTLDDHAKELLENGCPSIRVNLIAL